jgi:hypothetical protein
MLIAEALVICSIGYVEFPFRVLIEQGTHHADRA